MSELLNDQFELAEIGDDCYVVSATGVLDGDRALELKNWLFPVAGIPGARVLVDLGRASHVDSTTVGILTAAAFVNRQAGGSIVLVTTDRRLDLLLDRTGLRELAGVERTLQAGIERSLGSAAV